MHISKKLKALLPLWVLGLFLLILLASSTPIMDSSVCYAAKSKTQKAQEVIKRQQELQNKRSQNKAKIQNLKQKKYREVQELKRTESRLNIAKVSLKDQQFRLSMAQRQLNSLEKNLIDLNDNQKKLIEEASKRIRQIYKGEKLTLLHMVLGAKDISTFLDRLYYQKRIVQRDKELLKELKEKTKELVEVREKLKKQKTNIISSINNIEKNKREIAIAVNIRKDIVNKLNTDINAYERAERQYASEASQLEGIIRSLTVSDNSSHDVPAAVGNYIKPVSGRISSPYGYRTHPIFRRRKFHTGVDIAGRNRSPIRASNSGKVIYSGWYGGYGRVVIIDHGKSMSTLYAHMSSIKVSKGQKVTKGQTVGYEGSTGYSTGPHLHFEVRKNGKHTNPMSYIR